MADEQEQPEFNIVTATGTPVPEEDFEAPDFSLGREFFLQFFFSFNPKNFFGQTWETILNFRSQFCENILRF